jgi:hypothetical protein
MAARHAKIAAAGNKITLLFIGLLLETTGLPDIVLLSSGRSRQTPAIVRSQHIIASW